MSERTPPSPPPPADGCRCHLCERVTDDDLVFHEGADYVFGDDIPTIVRVENGRLVVNGPRYDFNPLITHLRDQREAAQLFTQATIDVCTDPMNDRAKYHLYDIGDERIWHRYRRPWLSKTLVRL